MKEWIDEEMIEQCSRIAEMFDNLNTGTAYGEEGPISAVTDIDGELDSFNIGDELREELLDVFNRARNVVFAIGFVIGQSFEVTYPEAQADVEAIKKVIRKKGLLPYVPKENGKG